MAEWYPVMLNISGRKCVVVGGGSVALRKTSGLLNAGAQVTIVSPQLTAELQKLADDGVIEWLPRHATDADVDGAALVFASTDRPDVNRRIAEAARLSNIPVNVADDGEAGDFVVPALVRRGQFVLTAGLSGAGPALAARVIRELSARYGPEYADYAEALRQIRRTVKKVVTDADERRRLLLAAADADALEEWRHADWLSSEPQRLLERLQSRAAAARPEEETT